MSVGIIAAMLILAQGTGMTEDFRDVENRNRMYSANTANGLQMTFYPKTFQGSCTIRERRCRTVFVPDMPYNGLVQVRDERNCLYTITSRSDRNYRVVAYRVETSGENCLAFAGVYIPN